MQTQFAVYSIPLLITTLLTGASAWLFRQRDIETTFHPDRLSTDQLQLFVLSLLTCWIAGSLVTVSFADPEMKVFGLFVTLASGTWVAAAWFCFVLLYTGRQQWVTATSISLLTAAALIVTITYATNGLHGLILTGLQPTADSSGTALQPEWGIGMWLIASYNLTLSLPAVWFLSKKFVTSRNVYRKIALVHIVAGLLLSFGPVISMAGYSPFPYLLLSSLGFSVIAVVSLAATVSYRYLSLIPLSSVLSGISRVLSLLGADTRNLEPMARDVVMQNMESGVIVLDHDNRIVDLNPKGKRMTGAEDRRIVGERLTDVVDPQLIRSEETSFLYPGTTGTFRGVWVASPGGETRCYDIVVNGLGEDDEDAKGRVALINDVTDRERRKEKLKQRTQEFDLLRQVQSRILRHNIRNDLTMIRGGVEQLTDDVDDPHAERILEATDDLMSISEKVRLVEDVIETDAERSEYDLRELLEGKVDAIEAEYPDAEISVEGPPSCRIEAITRLEVALENILENALEHNDSDPPRVTVTIEDEPTPTVTIADNGPGIPEQEVAVLEQEEESSLEHGSSIGLWLIKWIVDRSDADLSFETGADGTAVTIQFTAEQRLTDSPRSAASTPQ